VARFRDRVAIVTGAGAAGGIGAAVARALVAEGGRVVLGATSERVHQRAAELGDSALGVIADLTVDGAADTLVRAALDRWDRVDVLVNNAGMTSVTAGWDADDDVAEMSLAAWDTALDNKPVFAQLMLDEAFSKSDPQFAQQALSAFRKFGLQLVIVATVRNATTIQPYIDSVVMVSKTEATGRNARPVASVATRTISEFTSLRQEMRTAAERVPAGV
jgi:NAD(P)-dependent dehydrogenase (short-subunit alcohol dehydrogenase family)